MEGLRGLGYFLFSLLGGYCFLTISDRYRYTVMRQPGYHVAAKSAIVGFFFFILAFLLIWSTAYALSISGYSLEYLEYMARAACVTSLPLGIYGAYIHNNSAASRTEVLKTTAKRAAVRNGDIVASLLIHSVIESSLVVITLKDRKSYIGYITEFQSYAGSDIAMIPVLSGYRDKDTCALRIQTDYTRLLLEYTEPRQGTKGQEQTNWKPEDFEVVVPRSELTSARMFSSEVYREFLAEQLKWVAQRDNQ